MKKLIEYTKNENDFKELRIIILLSWVGYLGIGIALGVQLTRWGIFT